MSIQQVKDKCAEVFAKATELYGVDCSAVAINFNLRGRVAGSASRQGYYNGPQKHTLEFNKDLIDRELDTILTDVVPHEIAHIVCFMNPRLGSNHDAGWAHVCRKLGGTGSRTHSMQIVFGKGKTYEYTTTAGVAIRLSEQRHKAVQKGGTFTCKVRSKGKINKECSFTIVGIAGQTLSKPIAGNVPTTPLVDGVSEIPKAPIVADIAKELKIPVVKVKLAKGNESKADAARRLISVGFESGLHESEIIASIMQANEFDLRLATAYYKNNAKKLGFIS
jgi:SprT protein